MIDPKRKAQNEARARQLLDYQELLTDRLWEGDANAWLSVERIHQQSEEWRGPPLEGATNFIASAEAFAVANRLRERSVRPLRKAIRGRSLKFTLGGYEFEPREPLPWVGHNHLNVIAPLTWHVCLELLLSAGSRQILIADPSRGAPLSIERARYASEQTELIRVEHSLWQLAARHGGPSSAIPYAYRRVLIALAWNPIAHAAPGGAWALCVRCGELLHRTRSRFSSLPRCAPCMKETPAQRKWPAHAVAPHARSTWFLQCQYPGCRKLFEGPRHRDLCSAHTSSKLPPARRRSRQPARA